MILEKITCMNIIIVNNVYRKRNKNRENHH